MDLFFSKYTNTSHFNLVAGELRNIHTLKPWGLYEVLTDKYKWNPVTAQEFADFLTPMLEYEPEKRAKATDCLMHPFLEEVPDAATATAFNDDSIKPTPPDRIVRV